jgi:hypothetical protein
LLLARQRFKLDDGGVVCWVQVGSEHEHRCCKSLTVERGAIKYEWGRAMWAPSTNDY